MIYSDFFPGSFPRCVLSISFDIPQETSPNHSYAHMEIVLVLIVVKFFFLFVTRDHGSRLGRRHQVEILPIDLPELFKPARDLLEPTTTTRTTRTTTTRTTKTPRLFNFERIGFPAISYFISPGKIPGKSEPGARDRCWPLDLGVPYVLPENRIPRQKLHI